MDELSCPLCHQVFVEPVSTACDHAFCAPCIHAWLESGAHRGEGGAAPCPICRRGIHVRALKPAAQLAETVIARRPAEHAARLAELGPTLAALALRQRERRARLPFGNPFIDDDGGDDSAAVADAGAGDGRRGNLVDYEAEADVLGGLLWGFVSFLGEVVFGSSAMEGSGHGDEAARGRRGVGSDGGGEGEEEEGRDDDAEIESSGVTSDELDASSSGSGEEDGVGEGAQDEEGASSGGGGGGATASVPSGGGGSWRFGWAAEGEEYDGGDEEGGDGWGGALWDAVADEGSGWSSSNTDDQGEAEGEAEAEAVVARASSTEQADWDSDWAAASDGGSWEAAAAASDASESAGGDGSGSASDDGAAASEGGAGSDGGAGASEGGAASGSQADEEFSQWGGLSEDWEGAGDSDGS